MWYPLPKEEQFASFEMLGSDAFNFGQKLFSKDLKSIKPGSFRLSLFLSADAKVRAIFWVGRTEDGLTLIVRKSESSDLLSLIETYKFSEKFEIVEKPSAHSLWSEQPLTGLASTEGRTLGESGFEGHWRGLSFRLQERPHVPVGSFKLPVWNEARIKHMIPRLGQDYSETDLVFKVGLEELCDGNKGCYVGQEVVERVRSRGGKSPQRLSLIQSSRQIPIQSEIFDPAHPQSPVGHTTQSTVFSTEDSSHYSLCYLKSAYLDQDLELIVGEAPVRLQRE